MGNHSNSFKEVFPTLVTVIENRFKTFNSDHAHQYWVGNTVMLWNKVSKVTFGNKLYFDYLFSMIVGSIREQKYEHMFVDC